MAEIMNRKDFKIDRKKANAQDLRKKEKENRKLQLELNQEREKFNQMVVKHQKELNDMQAVSVCVCVHEYIKDYFLSLLLPCIPVTCSCCLGWLAYMKYIF